MRARRGRPAAAPSPQGSFPSALDPGVGSHSRQGAFAARRWGGEREEDPLDHFDHHQEAGHDGRQEAEVGRGWTHELEPLTDDRKERQGHRHRDAATASSATAEGLWLIDQRAAVQIYHCAGLMCGRILWLRVSRNALGQLDRDCRNPNPALRTRELCGLTMLWNLRPDGPNRWKDGWFYNPDDGETYRVSAQLKSDDMLVARIYLGTPLFGQTRRLARVPHGVAAGWC